MEAEWTPEEKYLFATLNERRLDLIDKLFSEESLADDERIELEEITESVSTLLRKTLGSGSNEPLAQSMNRTNEKYGNALRELGES